MSRLLVIGGSGYLGSELVRQALAGGWEVGATYLTQRPELPGARLLRLDVRDHDQSVALLRAQRPELIIYVAAEQDRPTMWATNVDGAVAVAQAARPIAARLIYVSSDAVFDGEHAGAYSEEDPALPISAYGRSKRAAEQQIAAADPSALLVRTSLIYGGATLSKHERLVLDALDGRADIAFYTDELRCPIVVGDLARALLALGQTDAAGLLHVAGADVVSRYEFAGLVAAAHGRDPALLRSETSPRRPELRRPRNCAMDCSRFARLLHLPMPGARAVLSGAPSSSTTMP